MNLLTTSGKKRRELGRGTEVSIQYRLSHPRTIESDQIKSINQSSNQPSIIHLIHRMCWLSREPEDSQPRSN
ncbi:hypothetical protein EYC84_008032 [Monilinia fructicola]|uniref:Uncharacterized protein n=1 Tax=Monilinia fructicola TaxID=38448 RepID=A0A5M9JFP1_MONFR|nr:hypothetical protein EYC84_008032 [Monilinia fructicola]